MFSFVNEEKSAECTLNIEIKKCKKVENSDENLAKDNTFLLKEINNDFYFQAESELERNQWITSLKFCLTNPGIVNEQDEIDYMNDPNRTHSIVTIDN